MAIAYCHDCSKNIDLDHQDGGMTLVGRHYEICVECADKREELDPLETAHEAAVGL